MRNNFTFTHTVSRQVLENYLSRAVTAQDIFNSDTLADDIRMLTSVGAKFIGRAAGVWRPPDDDDAHFARAAEVVGKIHAADPQIILQAAIFEAVYEGVERILVPGWVFEEFGLPVEERTFRYDAMLFPDGRHVVQWRGGGSVPDVRQVETRMWFFYRARRYIDAGFEAFHFGQVHLYGSMDRDYLATAGLLRRVREYAARRARRHMVLCDAHTNGISARGRLLFDLHATILFLREIEGRPHRCRIVRHGCSKGGISPSGWACDHLPYLAEFDNYGGAMRTGPHSIQVKKEHGELYGPGESTPGVLWPWGYDEIAWFAHQGPQYRGEFLRCAWEWFAANDPNGHLQMPCRRRVGGAPVTMESADGGAAEVGVYKANRPSPACPTGFGDEDAIREIWEGSAEPSLASCKKPSAPAGDEDHWRDPETGFDYPRKVVLAGTLQSALGGAEWETDSEVGRMEYIGSGRYRLAPSFPPSDPHEPPRSYEFRICIGGSWTENYGQGGIADGGNFQFTPPIDGGSVEFVFDYDTKELRVG